MPTKAKTKAKKVTKKIVKNAAKKTAKAASAKKSTAKKSVVKKVKKAKSSVPKKIATGKNSSKKGVEKKKLIKSNKPSKTKKIGKITEKSTRNMKEKKEVKGMPVSAFFPEEMQSASTVAVSQILGLSNIEPYQPEKNEEYMNEKMQTHFRKILAAWKHQLMEEVDRTVHHLKDEAANFPDPSDRATQEEEFSLELRTRDRERKLIRKIESVLKLLDEGQYGFCESCGVEIGLRRLEARPTATLCIDCKTLDEIREKQQGKETPH